MTQPADRVQMTVSGTPGTGNATLLAATPGYQTVAQAGILDGQTVSYLITDTGNAFEFGQCPYIASTTTLARVSGTVLGSSNSGSPLTLTSAAIVSLTLCAEDLFVLPLYAAKFLGSL